MLKFLFGFIPLNFIHYILCFLFFIMFSKQLKTEDNMLAVIIFQCKKSIPLYPLTYPGGLSARGLIIESMEAYLWTALVLLLSALCYLTSSCYCNVSTERLKSSIKVVHKHCKHQNRHRKQYWHIIDWNDKICHWLYSRVSSVTLS